MKNRERRLGKWLLRTNGARFQTAPRSRYWDSCEVVSQGRCWPKEQASAKHTTNGYLDVIISDSPCIHKRQAIPRAAWSSRCDHSKPLVYSWKASHSQGWESEVAVSMKSAWLLSNSTMSCYFLFCSLTTACCYQVLLISKALGWVWVFTNISMIEPSVQYFILNFLVQALLSSFYIFPSAGHWTRASCMVDSTLSLSYFPQFFTTF